MLFVIFPAGCHRVGLTVPQAVARAVWPAAWPAVVMTAYVVATRGLTGSSLMAVAAEYGVATLLYVGAFVGFGIGTAERRFYASKTAELLAFRLRPASEGV
jgi:hypothetical protein